VVLDDILRGYLRVIRCDKVVDRVVLYGAYLFLVSCIE